MVDELDYKANINYWADRWAQDEIDWHKPEVSEQLIANVWKLCDGVLNKTFFLPLCGKTVDILYLQIHGHKVFGVEAVPQPIEELNAEHGLGLKFNSETSTYATDDGRIKIYCGDIFTCPFEKFGPFDCIWDRGSFVAVDYPFRHAYKEMIQRSLQVKEKDSTQKYHNFKYLLETMDYDRTQFPGPPRAVDANDMETFFGDWTNIKEINRQTIKDEDATVQTVHYFLTPKN